MQQSPIKVDSVKYTTLVVAAVFIVAGVLFHNADVLRGLIEGVNPSFLPGF